MQGYHQTVLLKEVIDYLQIKEGQWYLDGTLGDGGHTLGILKSGGRVVAVDLDPEAISRATARFQAEGIDPQNYRFIEGNFKDFASHLDKNIFFAGAVLDLGVSTLQFKDPGRGFSFLNSGPLDMRMSPNLSVKAMDLVNALNAGELEQLFVKYGEESWAKRIAIEVIKSRPLQTTGELAQLVERVVKGPKGRIHPATKIFQALRIAVNDELFNLENALPQILQRLNNSARLAVISFHGLEDRIVKQSFRDWEVQGLGRELVDPPITPSEQELNLNQSSRSAKLRVFEVTR